MRSVTYRFLLLVIMVLSIVGCGGGGGGSGGDVPATKLFSSIITTINPPTATAVSTISFSGVSDRIICGIDLHLTYPTGTTYVDGAGAVSGAIPSGTILLTTPGTIGTSDAIVSIIYPSTDPVSDPGFGSGVIATINYTTVPTDSISKNFGATILKVFDCNGFQIQ